AGLDVAGLRQHEAQRRLRVDHVEVFHDVGSLTQAHDGKAAGGSGGVPARAGDLDRRVRVGVLEVAVRRADPDRVTGRAARRAHDPDVALGQDAGRLADAELVLVVVGDLA